jgi:hypothetical protein
MLVAAAATLSLDSIDQLTVDSFPKVSQAARDINFPPTATADSKSGKVQRKRPAQGAARAMLHAVAKDCAIGIEGGCWDRIIDLTPSRLQEIFDAHAVIESERALAFVQAVYAEPSPRR